MIKICLCFLVLNLQFFKESVGIVKINILYELK